MPDRVPPTKLETEDALSDEAVRARKALELADMELKAALRDFPIQLPTPDERLIRVRNAALKKASALRTCRTATDNFYVFLTTGTLPECWRKEPI